MSEGKTLADIFFKAEKSYTFDDLILLPGYIDFELNEVDLSSKLTRNITLQTPFVSSPMDTVTESDMAIKMALQGGIGIIHCNNSIEEQLEHVKRVKRYSNGVVVDPVTVGLYNTVSDVLELQNKNDFTSFPVVDDDGILRGIISRRDIEFVDSGNINTVCVKDIFNKNAVILSESCTIEEAKKTMIEKRVKRIPLVDEDGKVKGLICRKDIINMQKYPLATRDSISKQLLVGAAVSTHPRDLERIDKLVLLGNVDVIVVDSAQGCSKFQLDTIKYIKSRYPNVDVIGGNVVTRFQAQKLIDAGVDGLRVGMGVGSICTTQEVCGVGRGQCSAIYNVNACSPVPVIADGGISGSGSIIKALAVGASCVMMGSMLAGTDEAPGEVIVKDGVRLKTYRGMGSKAASSVHTKNQASKSRYCDSTSNSIFVAQGVTGCVASKGPIEGYVPYIIKAVKHGFQDIGFKNINDLIIGRNSGLLKAEIRTTSAQREGLVHHLYSYEK